MGKSTPSAPAPPDPYQTADAQGQLNRESAAYNAALNRINTYTPWGSQTFDVTGTDPTTGAPLYQQNINLSPEQQALLDAENQQKLSLSNLGGQVIDGLTGQPIDTSGLSPIQGGFNLGGPGIQRGIDSSGLPMIPGSEDLTAFRDEAEGALYDRNTAYLDQRYGRDEEALRSRLANQGIVEGSEAYSNAVDDFERGREMAYRQARNEAVIGGGAEAERMNRIGAGNRAQMYGELLGSGSFANQSRNQALSEALTGANLSNEARAQGLEELFALRNLPLNEYNAIRSMAQVNTPQFEGTARSGMNPADVQGAIYQNYQGQLGNYNADVMSRNALMQGLFGLGGAAILASDERVKDNIVPVGELNDGTSLYSFTYKGDDTPQVGVMAQEIEETLPEAVVNRRGVKHVDYARVLMEQL